MVSSLVCVGSWVRNDQQFNQKHQTQNRKDQHLNPGRARNLPTVCTGRAGENVMKVSNVSILIVIVQCIYRYRVPGTVHVSVNCDCAMYLPVKRHRGEPGHTRDTRDTRTHKGIYRYRVPGTGHVSVGGLTTPKLVVLVAFRWFWCELQTGEPLLVWK